MLYSSLFAAKSEAAGVDAVAVEGFEAGGHIGREETTTMCLIPSVTQAVDIPVIAAGGLYDGKSMLQLWFLAQSPNGLRFVPIEESQQIAFKNAVVEAGEGATTLTLKELTPVRMMHNELYHKLVAASQAVRQRRSSQRFLEEEELEGNVRGDLVEGELEIGQISSMLKDIRPAKDVVDEIIEGYKNAGGMKLGKRSNSSIFRFSSLK